MCMRTCCVGLFPLFSRTYGAFAILGNDFPWLLSSKIWEIAKLPNRALFSLFSFFLVSLAFRFR